MSASSYLLSALAVRLSVIVVSYGGLLCFHLAVPSSRSVTVVNFGAYTIVCVGAVASIFFQFIKAKKSHTSLHPVVQILSGMVVSLAIPMLGYALIYLASTPDWAVACVVGSFCATVIIALDAVFDMFSFNSNTNY